MAVLMKGVAADVHKHLGDQYHPIEVRTSLLLSVFPNFTGNQRREKPRVVQTGLYACVRHPLYSLAILQTTLLSFMFWSYPPLYVSIAVAIIFMVKIPIEEEVILRDGGIIEKYRAYMQKVPARLMPYVW
ncbi:hypothetical protein V8E55_003422 [Tylopilus felleus]